MKELLIKGTSLNQIARKLDTSASIIRAIIKNNNLEHLYCHKKEFPKVEIDKEDLRLAMEEGYSYHQLADLFNTSSSVILKRVKEFNFYPFYKKRNRFLQDNLEELTELYIEEGYSVQQIADRIGSPKGSVLSVLSRNGVFASLERSK